MAHYDDVIMPTSVRFGSDSVPMTETEQVFVGGGFRETNQRWSQKLMRLRLQYVDKIEDLYAIKKIWQIAEGPVHSFLVRDWNDWNTTDGNFKPGDESLVTAFDTPLRNTTDNTFIADGTTTVYQMVKYYTVGATGSHTRVIKKPQTGTIKVAVDADDTLSEGADFTVDYSTGQVTFSVAPGSTGSPTGVSVKWGGAFYVPVHFVRDDGLVVALRNNLIDEIGDLELMEERLS